MKRCTQRGRLVAHGLLCLVLVGGSVGAAYAQRVFTSQRWGWYRMPPRFPEGTADRRFTFARVMYRSVTRESRGQGWTTDYPSADINFMVRLSELTTTRISEDRASEPGHVVVTLTDDRLFNYPFIFMSDVGTAGLDDDEVVRLRAYLVKGGFLWVDDFWGPQAWEHWADQIGRVLPPSTYPVFDIPPTHPIFRGLHEVDHIPQIPGIQFWRMTGGATSERGMMSEEAHFRGIADQHGRLLVVMSHNTDIADGWEREGEDYEFFYRFSVKAYAFGINVALHAMTH